MPSQKLNLEPVDLGPTRVVHASSSRSDGTIPGRLVRCYQCGKEYGVCMGDLSRGRGIFCSRQCSGLYRRRSPIEILETYTCKTDTCWLWTGPADPLGYGHIILADGTRWLAHRLSWHIYRGPIPEGIKVCHACDNPPCIRPEPGHLFLGTQADNIHDAIAKGRPGWLDWRRKVPRSRGNV
jgi:hypothetical protein